MSDEEKFSELRKKISRNAKIVKEIGSLFNDLYKGENEERKMAFSQIKSLKSSLQKENNEISEILNDFSLPKPLPQIKTIEEDKSKNAAQKITGDDDPTKSKRILLRKKKEEKKPLKKVNEIQIGRKRISVKLFSGPASYLIDKGRFKKIQEDLVKANMKFLPKVYVSMIFFSTLVAFFASISIVAFLLFFNLGTLPPFITMTEENMLARFLKFFWLLLAIPTGTFVFMYFYPSLEKGSLERKINQELPFATINMSAIAGSLADPTKIFSIIILTKEYPALEKEFVKIINGVNVLGKDLITVLKNGGTNSPSKKLSDLFNGIATTINSGGDLPKFFDERAKNLLFEYKIDQEKDTRSAETFMDIYISIVIAAPMIFMLLMIMMQISGIGSSLSISAITLVMILGVSLINIVFLTFLHLKQPRN